MPPKGSTELIEERRRGGREVEGEREKRGRTE